MVGYVFPLADELLRTLLFGNKKLNLILLKLLTFYITCLFLNKRCKIISAEISEFGIVQTAQFPNVHYVRVKKSDIKAYQTKIDSTGQFYLPTCYIVTEP